MKAAAFAYERPSDLNAALALMAKAGGTTKIIAGGQSLGPMLNLRLVEPDLIVDISGLSELKRAERNGDELVIGQAAGKTSTAQNQPRNPLTGGPGGPGGGPPGAVRRF